MSGAQTQQQVLLHPGISPKNIFLNFEATFRLNQSKRILPFS